MPPWVWWMTRPENCFGFSGCPCPVPQCFSGLREASPACHRLACVRSGFCRPPAVCGVGFAELPLAMFYAGSIFYWPAGSAHKGKTSFSPSCSAPSRLHQNECSVMALTRLGFCFSRFVFGRNARGWAPVFFAGLLAVDGAWISGAIPAAQP